MDAIFSNHICGERMGAEARENRGGCTGVARKRQRKEREVDVLKRREAREITQCLIFRNRKKSMDSVSHFWVSACVLSNCTLELLWGRILTQFLAHPCNRKVKSLNHIVMVAKFLNLNNSWSCKHGRKGKRKKLTWMIALRNKAIAFTSIVQQCKMAVSVKKDCWDPEIMLPW